MKKLFILSVLLACNSMAIARPFDQREPTDYKHDISIGIGNYSSDELFDGNKFKGIMGTEYIYKSKSGTYTLAYRYFATPNLSLGAAVAIEKCSGAWDKTTGASPDLEDGYFDRTVVTLAPEMCYYYTDEGSIVTVYSTLGLGMSLQYEIDKTGAYLTGIYEINGVPLNKPNAKINCSRTHFNGQICPIGIKLGRDVSIFAELGFGYKGIYRGGLMMHLGWKKRHRYY